MFRCKLPQLDVASLSERGFVRPDNQDHVLVCRAHFTYGVADGMGGGDGGAKASEIVCTSVANALDARLEFPERVRRIHEALRTANAEIRAFAEKAGFTRPMASTAAVLTIDRDRGDQAAAVYIGDSRIYRFRAGVLRQISRDHTVVRELHERAAGRAVAAGLVRRHLAISHMLTRAVGILPDVAPEWRKIDIHTGDAFLICSDGVQDMVTDEEIRAIFARGGKARDMVARLAEKIVSGGAVDNYSMVVVRVGGSP
ncbi:MAG: PP2C family protein-serine/threonine phosphatase [Kiritimatiellia bacterium]